MKVGRDTLIQPCLTRPHAAGVDATRGFDILWWFERAGRHTRVEVLQLATDEYELRVIDADGVEQIEHFTKRQETIQQTLVVFAKSTAFVRMDGSAGLDAVRAGSGAAQGIARIRNVQD